MKIFIRIISAVTRVQYGDGELCCFCMYMYLHSSRLQVTQRCKHKRTLKTKERFILLCLLRIGSHLCVASLCLSVCWCYTCEPGYRRHPMWKSWKVLRGSSPINKDHQGSWIIMQRSLGPLQQSFRIPQRSLGFCNDPCHNPAALL